MDSSSGTCHIPLCISLPPPSPLLDYELLKGRDAVPQGSALGQDIADP